MIDKLMGKQWTANNGLAIGVLAVLSFGLSACSQEPEPAPAPEPVVVPAEPAVPVFDEAEIAMMIAKAADGDHRNEENRARNSYRRPEATLTYFGLRPDMTVVEIWPGTGWYTEVLAPVLRDHGQLVAASFHVDEPGSYRARMDQQFRQKLADNPEVYDQVKVIPYDPHSEPSLGKPGSADMVILSRHMHNFVRRGGMDNMLQSVFAVLKPGGTFAVIQHRADPDVDPPPGASSGYLRQAYVIGRVVSAGFQFDGASEINANPRDSRDHPSGVWTLPPTLRYCRALVESRQPACEEQYRAIGESDRMTLRFIRP